MTAFFAGTTFQRVARGIVVAACVVALGLWIGFAVGPERAWWLAQAQYLPYPMLVLPVAVACAFAWRLGWRWRVAGAGAAFVVLVPVMGLHCCAASHRGSLRIMTYNVKDYLARAGDGGAIELITEILEHSPDIVVLQDARKVGAILDRAAPLAGLRHVFQYGQFVIASRFPLRDCDHGDIPFRDQSHSYATCVVTVGERDVEVATAHFVTPRDGLNALRHLGFRGVAEWNQNVDDRMQQADELARHLEKQRRPLILAGDLNAPGPSLVARRLEKIGLVDAFAAGGTGYGYTYGHAFWPGLSFLRIDRVLVSPELSVVQCFVGGRLPSPHRPVIADLAWVGA